MVLEHAGIGAGVWNASLPHSVVAVVTVNE